MSRVHIYVSQEGKVFDNVSYSVDQMNYMQDVKMTLAKRLIDSNRENQKISNVKDVGFVVYGNNSLGVEIRYSFVYNLSAQSKLEIIELMNSCVLSVKREVSI